MLFSYDTDDILYTVLTASEGLRNAISGGIYNTDRPEGSAKEDITINTISINGEMPAGGNIECQYSRAGFETENQ